MSTFQIILNDPERGESYDITNRVKAITIDKQASGESNQINIKAINIEERHIWNEFEIFKDSIKIAGGTVVNQSDAEQGGIKQTTFTCLDYSYLFLRRLVATTYTASDFDGKATYIVNDIITNKVPEITTNHIVNSDTSIISGDDAIIFPYVTVMEALTSILEHLRNYKWYVDADLDFHLYSVSEKQGTDLTDNFLKNTLAIEYLSDTAVNRVWVVGAEKPADTPIDEYFTGDGVKRFFKLSYRPNDFYVYENGVENTNVALLSNDNGSYDYLIDNFANVLVVPTNATPYSGPIKLNYKPTIQVIEQQSNPTSIKTFGTYEKAIKDTEVTTKLNARKIATNELKDHDIKSRQITCRTQTAYDLGELVNVDIDGTWNIQGAFMVDSVTHLIESNGYEEYNITLKEVI